MRRWAIRQANGGLGARVVAFDYSAEFIGRVNATGMPRSIPVVDAANPGGRVAGVEPVQQGRLCPGVHGHAWIRPLFAALRAAHRGRLRVRHSPLLSLGGHPALRGREEAGRHVIAGVKVSSICHRSREE
jgi:hypothetical protein